MSCIVFSSCYNAWAGTALRCGLGTYRRLTSGIVSLSARCAKNESNLQVIIGDRSGARCHRSRAVGVMFFAGRRCSQARASEKQKDGARNSKDCNLNIRFINESIHVFPPSDFPDSVPGIRFLKRGRSPRSTARSLHGLTFFRHLFHRMNISPAGKNAP